MSYQYFCNGSRNIVVAENSDSAITINAVPEELEKAIQTFLEVEDDKNPSVLRVLVVAATVAQIQDLNLEDINQEIIDHQIATHGESPADWKPFAEEGCIFEVLKEYSRVSGIKVELLFTNQHAIAGEVKMRFEEEFSENLIVIIDCVTLIDDENEGLFDALNRDKVGGGIVPVCNKLGLESQKFFTELQRQKLERWQYYKYKNLRKAYLNIELDTPDKKRMFRRITNIALENLHLKTPSKSQEWLRREFNQAGLDSQSAGL